MVGDGIRNGLAAVAEGRGLDLAEVRSCHWLSFSWSVPRECGGVIIVGGSCGRAALRPLRLDRLTGFQCSLRIGGASDSLGLLALLGDLGLNFRVQVDGLVIGLLNVSGQTGIRKLNHRVKDTIKVRSLLVALFVCRRLECLDFLIQTGVHLLLHVLLLLLELALELLQLLLQPLNLWRDVWLFGKRRLQVDPVVLGKAQQRALRVSVQRLVCAHHGTQALIGRHPLLRPHLLIWPHQFADGVESLAVVRVLLLLAGDVALVLLPVVLPRGQKIAVFRVRGELAELVPILLAPNGRGFQRGKLLRERVCRLGGLDGGVCLDGLFDFRNALILQ